MNTAISQVDTALPERAVISRSKIITSGLAIFAMQFGAGNIVFALAVGQYAQDKNLFAILGLILSGVIVPLLGLIAMTLFDGDYKSFFARIGKMPGLLLTTLILGLLGPFGAIPRCIALSHATTKMYMPNVSLILFSICCCLFIFLCTIKRARILELLGKVLTPMKLGSLVLLIICGYFFAPSMPTASHNEIVVFLKGFTDGYQPMDLLGSFFICAIILNGLKSGNEVALRSNPKALFMGSLKASCLGAFLLGIIYFGFSYVAALHSEGLANIKAEELVSKLATIVLGSFGGIFVSFTVTLACMTTAIALTTVFADFIHKDVSKEKVSYPIALIGTIATTFFISTLNFTGIVKMLAPILALCYPALIVLCVLNILHKLYGFKTVKEPVMLVFALSLLAHFML